MKVNVTMEFDEKRWADEYGLAGRDVRQDFLSWLTSTLYCAEIPIEVKR